MEMDDVCCLQCRVKSLKMRLSQKFILPQGTQRIHKVHKYKILQLKALRSLRKTFAPFAVKFFVF